VVSHEVPWSSVTVKGLLTVLWPLRSEAKATRWRAYSGARRGELLYLRWSALDLEAGEVTLGGSTAVVRGHRVEGTTKGGRSRVISIDHETVAAVRDHLRRQAEERLAAGSAWADSGGLVFVGKWGEPLYPDTVTALMAKMIKNYNKQITEPARQLPHARLHDLRHLHATTLLLAGVPVHVVAARLGHADTSVTLRVSPTYSASTARASETFSPRPSGPQLANPLATAEPKTEFSSACAGESGGQGRGRTADLPLSGLGIAVQNWPYTSLCLLSGRWQPSMNRDTRTCMRLEMRLDAGSSEVLRWRRASLHDRCAAKQFDKSIVQHHAASQNVN
jgi:Phage integrase family